jgi:4-cresol dehydrogenase (hydroxylating) flavoprotein subunit
MEIDVREDRLSAALEAFVDVLGRDAVVRDRDELREFRDPYVPASWDEHTASAMVLPTSVEQVRAVVGIANDHGVPLWTFSQGRNYGYGGPAPRVRRSVLVNLRRMDRILEIHPDLAYALVEPGVRFFDLYDAIRAAGHKLWPSIPDLGWGSVVGNTLDHGVGFTPLGDHPGRQCGMEIVLGDGEVLRTGMGAMATSRAWQAAKRGFGPSLDGLFMQSNFGIVTKLGVWLLPEPERYVSCDVQVPEESDLGQLVEAVRPLLLDGTIPNTPIAYNAPLVAGAFGGLNRADYYQGDGPVPDEIVRRMAADAGVGWWWMRFALYGREDVVEAQLRHCERAFSAIPGASMAARRYDGATVADALAGGGEGLSMLQLQSDRTQAGIPGLELLDNISWSDESGTSGHLDFSPIAPLTGVEALRQNRFLRELFEAHGFDYAASLMMSPRSFINICSLWFDTADEEQTRAAYDFLKVVATAAVGEGWGAYRAHLHVMDTVAETYGFNDGSQGRVHRRIKRALDPNGVLAPGKSGIWPDGRLEDGEAQ